MKICNLLVTVVMLTAMTACDRPEDILLQKFDSNPYSLTIEGNKESSKQSLHVKKNERKFVVQLRENPVQIKNVSADSIFIEYYVFASTQEAIEYKSIDGGFTLVEHFNQVVGTLLKNDYNIDRVESHENTVLFYSNDSLVDSLNKNNLLYSGTYFFEREFDRTRHYIYNTKFIINDKAFIKSYGK
jgi:hypothetical protein